MNYSKDGLRFSPEENMIGERLLKEWLKTYDEVSEQVLNQEEQEVMKQGSNSSEGFPCFALGRVAPFLFEEFSVRDPFERDKDAESQLDMFSESYFRDETVHFVNLHYNIALKLFQVGAYIGSIETEKVKDGNHWKDPKGLIHIRI